MSNFSLNIKLSDLSFDPVSLNEPLDFGDNVFFDEGDTIPSDTLIELLKNNEGDFYFDFLNNELWAYGDNGEILVAQFNCKFRFFG